VFIMDVDEASQALDEMRRREQQTLERGSPRRAPAWFTYGTGAALTLIWASGDVEGLAATGLLAAGVLGATGLAIALERTTGVRLRMRGQRWTPMVLLVAAMLAVAIVVGTVLRLFDVPLASTLGGLASAAVVILGMGSAQAAAARGLRNPQ
jgi:hypothetical protein